MPETLAFSGSTGVSCVTGYFAGFYSTGHLSDLYIIGKWAPVFNKKIENEPVFQRRSQQEL